jgi:hypothetical protein
MILREAERENPFRSMQGEILEREQLEMEERHFIGWLDGLGFDRCDNEGWNGRRRQLLFIHGQLPKRS